MKDDLGSTFRCELWIFVMENRMYSVHKHQVHESNGDATESKSAAISLKFPLALILYIKRSHKADPKAIILKSLDEKENRVYG